jgi:hypothetical protein
MYGERCAASARGSRLGAYDGRPAAGLYDAQRSRPELGKRIDFLKMQVRQAEKITAHGFRHALAKIREKTATQLPARTSWGTPTCA